MSALGATRDPRAADVIRAHLQVDAWADWVRQGALKGLAATRDMAVLPDLLACAQVERGDRTRAGAARALAALADHGEDAVRTTVVERLCAMLAEPGFRVQLAAIAGLAQMRDPRALGPLQRVHATAPDGRTRRSAYEAMVRIREGRTPHAAISTLRQRVESLAAQQATLRQRLDEITPVPTDEAT